MTNVDEALAILKANSSISRPLKRTYGFEVSIYWSWVDGSDGGWIYFGPNGKVYAVRPYGGPRFSDVLDTYGDPTHVMATIHPGPEGGWNLSAWLVYLPQGLALYWDRSVTTPDANSTFTPDQVVVPAFFVPTEAGFRQAVNQQDQDSQVLVPWQGFHDFDFYCRDPPNPTQPCTYK